jgi:ZIP family zinc transporter
VAVAADRARARLRGRRARQRGQLELFEEGINVGGAASVGIGLAAGALAYFLLSRVVEHLGPGGNDSPGGMSLALGAFLDGIPEQIVLGIGIAAGAGVSIGLLVAIYVSNLPEAIGSAADMRASGSSVRQSRLLWLAVAGLCALATPLGYFLAQETGGHFQALINGFAAGALLVMLVDSMIPEATEKSGRRARDRAGLRRRRGAVDRDRLAPNRRVYRRASSNRGSSRTAARSSSSRACSRNGGNPSTPFRRWANVSSSTSPASVAKHA